MPDAAAAAPDTPRDLNAVFSSEEARQELRGWCVAGVLALGLAGVFALLLAFSRMPGTENLIPWPHEFFEKGLVLHVIYSFVVWFLAVLCALAAIAIHAQSGGAPKKRIAAKTAIQLFAGGELLLAWPVFLEGTEPSLNNYIPVLIHPLYYLALAFLFFGVLFQLIRLFSVILIRKPKLDTLEFSILTAAAAFVGAFIALCVGVWHGGAEPPSPAGNEDIFWGAGHVLQFVNVALMAGAWAWLASHTKRTALVNEAVWKPVIGFLMIAALAAPLIYAVSPPFSIEQRLLFTNMQYLLAPTPVILAALIAAHGFQGGQAGAPQPGSKPAKHGLHLSILVFFTGAFLGLFVDGTDTRTPAHYHGVIGGVNLAFMALFFALLLPLLKRPANQGRAAVALLWLYGAGQFLHCLGLFFAGGYGAPRKTAGDIAGLEAVGAQIALYAMGVGALIAVTGGAMFIWITLKALMRKPSGTQLDVQV